MTGPAAPPSELALTPVALTGARVRPERAAAFARLAERLFARRHTVRLGAWDQLFLRAELEADLRSISPAFAASAPEGSSNAVLPFALGFFRVAGDAIEPVAAEIPVEDAALTAAMLAEVLEPGARITLGERSWRVGDAGGIEPWDGPPGA